MNWKMNFRTLTLLIGLILFFDSCGSNQKENIDNKSADSLFAMDQLQGSLTDSTLHNCVDRKRILIKNKNMAISIAEPILFSIYGEQKREGSLKTLYLMTLKNKNELIKEQ